MKKKLLTSMSLLAAVFLMASCLKGEDRDVTYYEDTAITSFAVGTLKERSTPRLRPVKTALTALNSMPANTHSILIKPSVRSIIPTLYP